MALSPSFLNGKLIAYITLAITVTPKPTPYVTATLAFFVTKIHKNDETALQKPIIIAPTIDD